MIHGPVASLLERSMSVRMLALFFFSLVSKFLMAAFGPAAVCSHAKGLIPLPI